MQIALSEFMLIMNWDSNTAFNILTLNCRSYYKRMQVKIVNESAFYIPNAFRKNTKYIAAYCSAQYLRFSGLFEVLATRLCWAVTCCVSYSVMRRPIFSCIV